MTRKNTERTEDVEIALVGYSQAGKTTLAVGLYATSTPDFTVTGINEDTEYYLCGRRALLESGRWLDSTQERERPELALSLRRSGNAPVTVRFKEYMGELASNSESYKRDVIGRPKGALILLNPKMEILSDVIRRVEMISQLKDLIGYLSSPDVNCSYIGLVTTASDLLESAPPQEIERFEQCKAEIVNCLRTSAYKEEVTWKAFDVSVCGKLEDPQRPTIAHGEANTSRLPFEWLVDRIQRQNNCFRYKRMIRLATCGFGMLLTLGCAIFSSWYWGMDRSFERQFRLYVEASSIQLETACKLAREQGKLGDLNKSCQEIEQSIAEASQHQPFFAANQKRMADLLIRSRELRDAGRSLYYPLFLEQQAKVAAEWADETGCAVLRGKLEDWSPMTSEACDCRQTLIKRFDELLPMMRTAYENRCFAEGSADLKDRLLNFTCAGSFQDSLHDLLMDCRRYEDLALAPENHSLVALDVRREVWKTLDALRWTVLRKLVKWQMNELDIHGAHRPELTSEQSKSLSRIVLDDEALRGSDYTKWQEMLQKALKECQDKWVEYQGKQCNDLITEMKSARSAYDALLDFGMFYEESPDAPQLDSVIRVLHGRLGYDFTHLVNPLRESHTLSEGARKSNWESLNQLCTRLAKTKCDLLKKSCWYQFAKDCCEKGHIDKGIEKAFLQTYKVTRIDFAFTVNSLNASRYPFYFDLSGHLGSIVLNKHTVNQSVLVDRVFQANHWCPRHIYLNTSVDDREKIFIYQLQGGSSGRAEWEVSNNYFVSNWTEDDTDVDVKMTVYIEPSGDNIWDYLPKNTTLVLQ